jgi:predicted CXXCH cytochrome family protein
MSMRSVVIISRCLLFFLLLMTLQCSITEKRYKVLKIFFDGVPDPKAQVKQEEKKEKTATETRQAEGTTLPQRQSLRVIKSSHPDFANHECNKCHNKFASNFLKAKKDKICFTCHDSSDFKGKFVHGPAAVNDCLTCHFPHESQYESLLKQTSAQLCLECHLGEDIVGNPLHPFKDTDPVQENCTRCHSPHASELRFLLKGS